MSEQIFEDLLKKNYTLLEKKARNSVVICSQAKQKYWTFSTTVSKDKKANHLKNLIENQAIYLN